MSSNYLPLLLVGRPAVSFIAGIACGVLVHKDAMAPMYLSVLAAFCTMSVTMFGFTINDIFDRVKDISSTKYKPIARNELTVLAARRLCCLHILFVFSISFIYFNVRATIIYFVLFLLLYAYSIVSKRAPLIKGMYTAGLTLFPILLAIFIADAVVERLTIIGIFLFIFFRECVLDAMDIESDLKGGIKTLAYYSGVFKLEVIGWVGMICSVLYLFFMSSGSNAQYLYAIALVILLVSVVLYTKNREVAMKVSRLALLAGAIAVGAN